MDKDHIATGGSEDNDYDYYIFKSVLEAILGPDVWGFINNNSPTGGSEDNDYYIFKWAIESIFGPDVWDFINNKTPNP